MSRSGERLIVKKKDEILLDVLASKVDQIFVFGNCLLTTPAMTYCLKEGIPIIFLSSRGQYYGVLEAPLGDHVSLHRQQFARASEPDYCLTTAKSIVSGKLRNSRTLLQRYRRSRGVTEISSAIEALADIITRLDRAETLEEVHGYEGAGAARYYDAFAHLVDEKWGFTRRVKRPPTDPVNSLLSLGYTLLFYNIYSLTRARGLHPYVGYLHSMRDGHPSLASDIEEEFRAPVVDSLVIYLLNSGVMSPEDFYKSEGESRPCLLRDDARKTFLRHFEQKMGTRMTHPHTGYSADYRRCIDLQVLQMAQYIRGEIESYRPMVIR